MPPTRTFPVPPHRRFAFVAVFAMLALAILTAPLGSGPRADATPRAAGDRVVTLSKTTGIARGESITVSWSGYAPDSRVHLYQCKKDTAFWTGCAEMTRVEGQSDGTGAGSAQFPIWGGNLPRVDATANSLLTCNNNTSLCDVVVSECQFSLNPALTGRASFKVGGGTNPTTSTTSTSSSTTTTIFTPEPAERITVAAGGSSEIEEVLSRWQRELLGPSHLVTLDYTMTNSPSGNGSFTGGFLDASFTGLPLTQAQIDQLAAGGQGVAYVPLAVGALTLATEWSLNQIPLQKLRLSAATTAKIFQGELTLFFEQAITDDMGGCDFPVSGKGPRGSFRTDQSSSNYWFTHWLDTLVDESVWSLGSQTIFPIDSSLVTGQTGAHKLAEWMDLGGNGNTDQAPLGYFDYSWVRRFDLMPVEIENGAGEWVVPSKEGVEAALAAGVPDANGYLELDPGSTDPGVYPLTVVYYAAVPTEYTTTFPEEEADALRRSLEYMVSADGQTAAEEAGFFPLTPALQTMAADAIAKLPVPEEPTTTTTSLPLGGEPFVPTPGFSLGPPVEEFAVPSFGDTEVVPGAVGAVDDGGPVAGTASGAGGLEVAAPTSTDEPAETGEPEAVVDGPLLARLLPPFAAVPSLPTLVAIGFMALLAGPVLRFFSNRSVL